MNPDGDNDFKKWFDYNFFFKDDAGSTVEVSSRTCSEMAWDRQQRKIDQLEEENLKLKSRLKC